ncbi:MAG: 50S ribosomal protein L32 [Kiritimatiellia bacterium]
MAVPKRKTSKSRSRRRKREWEKVSVSSGVCPQCGAPRRNHRICPSCGYYRGRQVITVEAR